MLARLGGLVGEPVDEVGVELPCRQDAGAAGGDPQQVGDARLVDRQEGVEHGGHQDRAAVVRLGASRW